MSVKPIEFVWKSKKEQVEILRGMSMADLRDFIKKLKAQLFELKMQHRATIYVVGNRVIWWWIRQPHLIRKLRRAIARAKTILKEKIHADKKYFSQWSLKRKKAAQ